MIRTVTALLVLAGASAPTLVEAQGPPPREPTRVGVLVGAVRSDGVWTPEAESEAVRGGVLGAFITASTPASWFSIHVDGAWVQRNSDVLGTLRGEPLRGGVRADYLTVAVQTRFSAALGPVRFHVTGGPAIDQLMRSRLDPTLRSAQLRDIGTVFGVVGGLGLGVGVGDRYRVELEVRRYEGLGDAYDGDFIQLRHRSFGIVARVGIPRPSG